MKAMAAKDDSPIDINVARARRALELMRDHPFVLLVFTEEGTLGFAKGLEDDAVAVINDMINNAQA